MKRSSSKLIAKAGSMRNINKTGFRFTISLYIEAVEKVLSANEIVLVWERNAKVLTSKAVRVEKDSRTAHFGGELLSQEVTLFKKKKENAKFEEKVFRLAIRNAADRGKVVGKIDVNFADHVDIPSSSKRIAAPLNNGSRVVMRVESKFLGEAVKKKGSRGTGSSASSTVDTTDNESEFDPQDGVAEMGDLDDLDIEEPMETPTSAPTLSALSSSSNRAAPPRRPPLAPSASLDEPPAAPIVPLHRKPSAPSPGRERPTRSRDASPVDSRGFDPSLSAPIPSVSRTRRTPSHESNDLSSVSNGAFSASRSEADTLRRENRVLTRRNDDLQSRVADLERKLDAAAYGGDQADTIDELMVENKRLNGLVEELEVRISREPSYNDIVRELRETKMALAIVSMERDQLKNEIRIRKK